MNDVVQTLTQDLRLALLVAGALVLLLIVGWEVLQRRKASRADSAHLRGPLGQARSAPTDDLSGSDPLLDGATAARVTTTGGRPIEPQFDAGNDDRREPTLTLPEINVRDRLVEPPLVDLDIAMTSGDRGSSIPVVGANEAPLDSQDDDLHGEADASPMATDAPIAQPAPPKSTTQESGPEKSSSPTRAPVGEPVIIALRVVAREGERFTGAALRQALQGEGFVHGEMNIFHRAVADGRTLMSAASLTKPGSFDLATMDSSRFLGLNLFAVLPGPLPGRDTVDKLLLVGHTLSQRLRGQLLDAKGQALTETRLAELRREAATAGGG